VADKKEEQEEQAGDEGRRRRERQITDVETRADEGEPPPETRDVTDAAWREDDDGAGSPPRCHRRGCDEPARFEVLERYLEETGHGAVEARAVLCREHTDDESPTNLDAVYDGYVFRVVPLPGTDGTDPS